MRLRDSAMIETQHPAEPLSAFDGARRRFDAVTGFDQSVVESRVHSRFIELAG